MHTIGGLDVSLHVSESQFHAAEFDLEGSDIETSGVGSQDAARLCEVVRGWGIDIKSAA